MPLRKLIEYLDNECIKYVVITHSPAFTAQEVAAESHIPGREIAKTVMVKVDGKMAMAVMPASDMVDFNLLKTITGADDVTLADEGEFKFLFPNCTTGAMPPFGNLYGMDVYVSQSLTEDEQIAFNAGSHTELVRLAYKDFERLVQPRIAAFATHV